MRTKSGTNIAGAGEHNRRVIMHGLRINGAMSRAQIARSTGLVKQTVSNIVEELEREGLVRAAQPLKQGRGQPATPYGIHSNGAFALGLQIDQHRVRAAAVDLLGQIVSSTEAVLGSSSVDDNLATILAALERVTDTLGSERKTGTPRILGIGLAMPAPTGVHALAEGVWLADFASHNPVAVLEARTGFKVSLHHDASAAAVAERLNGRARGYDNFLLMFVGYGLGAGIYIGGELYRGHDFLAGEIGLIPVPDASGSVPLESLTSLSALFARLGLHPSQQDAYPLLEQAVSVNSPIVNAWIAEAAAHLCWTTELIGCVIDPECIVIAGQMPASLLDVLFATISAHQQSRPIIAGLPRPTLVKGSADPFSVAAGAAAYPIAAAFDPSFSAMLKG